MTDTTTRTAKLGDMIAAILDPATLTRRSSVGQRFARELCETVRAAGATPRQLDKIAELFREALALAAPATAKVDGKGLAALRDLFDRAHENGLKRPAVSVRIEGSVLGISRAADTSKNPGALYVKVDGEYAGKVGRDGVFRAVPGTEPAIAARLAAFGADPAGLGAKHGRLTGDCCFCSRPLNDARSTAVGYGPVCASRFELAWGVKAAADAYEAAHQPALV